MVFGHASYRDWHCYGARQWDDAPGRSTGNAFLELAVTRTYKPLIKSLPFERTPGGGGHLGYLCAEWAGNTKLAERGVILTYEAVRYWCRKFGQVYANQLRRRRPRPGDKWHLDKVFLTIRGERHYLWRAVDQDGHVLDILVQRRRDMHAARKFFRKLLKGCRYVPRVIITDRLKSYGAAKREILPGVEHRQHRYLNNWAENSHQPTRHRERHMRGFKSPGHAQRFLSAYGPIAQHFRPRRHLLPAPKYRQEMGKRFHTWQDLTRLRTAA